MTEKYLIVNADDFGMCHAQNLATAELFRCGTVTSATVMAPCPAVECVFRDPQTLQHIRALGIKLINYRDLARMRK